MRALKDKYWQGVVGNEAGALGRGLRRRPSCRKLRNIDLLLRSRESHWGRGGGLVNRR